MKKSATTIPIQSQASAKVSSGRLTHGPKRRADAPNTQTALVPVKQALAVVPGEDEQMGQQLTVQFKIAVGGMRAVLIFAAMFKQIRERLSSARGTKKLPRGVNSEGGLKAWLEKFAPEVNQSTAYRFEAVLDAVKEQFKALSPAALTKAGGFEAFVLAAPDQLPAKLASKQLELWSFVDGTSQRSWLDMFKPKKPLGGRRERDPNKAAGEPDTPEQAAIDLCKPLMADIAQEFLLRKTWSDLPDAMRRELRGLLYDAYKLIPE